MHIHTRKLVFPLASTRPDTVSDTIRMTLSPKGLGWAVFDQFRIFTLIFEEEKNQTTNRPLYSLL